MQSTLFLLRPLQFVSACQRRYGDLFRLRITGLGEIVYLADLQAIREVFAADGIAGHAGEANAVLTPVTGAQSILTLDREEHLRERRLISPALDGDTLAAARREVAQIATDELAGWPSDAPFALRPALQRITFGVIARLLLGGENAETERRLRQLLEPMFNVSLAIMAPGLQRDLGRLSPWRRFQHARADLDAELREIIAKRRSEPPGRDLLSLLTHGATPEEARSDEQARDELVTLLLAGHETSATALAWAFERLARNPHALRLARQAAITGEERYLEAVAYETLRVRPVVLDVGRVLDRQLTVGGYQIPAGTTLMPSIYLVHGDRRCHPEPDAFRPERFLDSRPDPSSWLPFGGGRRRCAGAAFALMEIRTVLAVVLARRNLRAPDAASERAVLRGITFAPKHGAFMELPPG